MVSENHKQEKIGALFVPEDNCLPIADPEFTEVVSSGFDVDNFSISSVEIFGPQSRNILPIKLDIKEERESICKPMKLMDPAQQCYHNVPENSSPLGLTLRKTPSFLDLIESKLSHSSFSCSESRKRKSADADCSVLQINGKTKASNFSASLLQIGSWVRTSRYEGDLVVKFYYAKRKLVWEVLDSGLKSKLEVPWSDIASLKATGNDSNPQTLELELLRPPLFFEEMNPQPRKHTLWKTTVDFTGGQASTFRRHLLKFPQGTLQKHYEKVLQLDNRLFSLSKKSYPSLDSPYFEPETLEKKNPNDQKVLGLEAQYLNLSKQLLESGTSDDCSDCFILSRTTLPRQHPNLDDAVASSESSSARSGASGSCISQGTWVSFSSFYAPLPQSLTDFGMHNMSECYHYLDKAAADEAVATELLGNNYGISDLHSGKLNSTVNIDSTFDCN